MKRFITSLAIVLICVSGVTYLTVFTDLGRSFEGEGQSSFLRGENTHVVKITPQGYEPEVLNIRQGDTVTWINADNLTQVIDFPNSEGARYEAVHPGDNCSKMFKRKGDYNYTLTWQKEVRGEIIVS